MIKVNGQPVPVISPFSSDEERLAWVKAYAHVPQRYILGVAVGDVITADEYEGVVTEIDADQDGDNVSWTITAKQFPDSLAWVAE